MDISEIFKNTEFIFEKSNIIINPILKEKLFNIEKEITTSGSDMYDDHYLTKEESDYLDKNPDKDYEIYNLENMSKNKKFLEGLSSVLDDFVLENSKELENNLKRKIILIFKDRNIRNLIDNKEPVLLSNINFDLIENPYFYSLCFNLFVNNDGDIFEYYKDPLDNISDNIVNIYGIEIENNTDYRLDSDCSLSIKRGNRKSDDITYESWKDRGYSLSKIKKEKNKKREIPNFDVGFKKKRKVDQQGDIDME
jgi:hypothetical protein